MRCGIGQPGHVCDRPATVVIAVHAQPDVWTTDRTPGVVPLCDQHLTLSTAGEWITNPQGEGVTTCRS